MYRRVLLGAGLALATAVAVPVLSASPAGAVAGRNLPPNGKVLFLAGQTTPDLTAYKTQVLDTDASFPRPGGVTLYTNISPNACNGLTATCNLNGNIFNFDQTLAEYPGASLAVGLYLADNPGCYNQPLRAIIGRQDADIAGAVGQQYRQNLDNLITYLRNTGRPVYLRVGYEFDGPWNCYNADFYKQAFRVVKQRIDALGATNVATVWQSASYAKDGDPAYGFDFSNPNHLDAWYPGDDVVDWVAMSTFYWDATYRQYQWACDTPTSSPRVLYDRVLNFARGHNKPAMIAEATPQAYRTANLDASCTNVNNRVSLNGDWTRIGSWYDQYFAYVTANTDVLRAAAYINSNWEAIAQFACPPGASAGQPGCSDGYWGNSRIQDNANVRAAFKRELQNSSFVNGTLVGRGANWGGGTPPTSNPPTSNPPSSPPPTGGGGNRNAFATIEAESWNSQSGTQRVTTTTASGGAEVGYTNNGDWVRFDGVTFAGRTPNQVVFRYSSGRPTSQSFTLEFHAGSATGPVIAAPGLLGTGDWRTYREIAFNVSNLPAGTTSITAVIRAGDSADVLDFDWFKFV
ncbi:carbohydrate-binding protein [Dactylosporangium sp. AC04546]|uniref:carbohydrate-binding protein n=1 Tax=Dactylosporangium sp. AC04546 TaxID=2862460 RepID=UPI001EDE7344|nr:carbohydrate-binding protein [Dactylosporangium sp. AC04546]WVK81497.1 carbohydrate-binding protein [Dactylosporangium sp. AC04546]